MLRSNTLLRPKWFAALLLACAAVPPATAQKEDEGTYDVFFQQLSAAGRLEGCSLIFTGLVKDFAYNKGAPVIINGSLAFRTMAREGDLFFTGKLGTRQLGPPDAPFTRPEHFHFATATASSAPHAKIVDGEPGYRLLLTRVDSTMVRFLDEMLATGGFNVGFNRIPGGQDVLLPIRVNVAVTTNAAGQVGQRRNDATAADFLQCVGRLVEGIKK